MFFYELCKDCGYYCRQYIMLSCMYAIECSCIMLMGNCVIKIKNDLWEKNVSSTQWSLRAGIPKKCQLFVRSQGKIETLN